VATVSEPREFVTYQRRRTNHLLHLVLSCLTLGLWLPVWFFVHLWNKRGPREKVVTKVR
jgi:hypothetical protein